MSLNIFYLSPNSRKSVSIELNPNQSVEDLCELISSKELIPKKDFKLYSNGRALKTTRHLTNDSIIGLHFGLNGGKGGFGSMLRAIGAQIEKTTNREACRDLTGRRLRDINEEKRIKEWIKKEKQRKEEMEEKRRQKLKKLSEEPKVEFNDIEFERTRSEIPDIVDEAVLYGLNVQQRQQSTSSSGCAQEVNNKRKRDQTLNTKTKKKKVSLWIGVDGISDDSDDDEEETTEVVDEHIKEDLKEDIKEDIVKDTKDVLKE